MEFSVLDKQTIQCIMTEKEMAGYGLDKQALLQNDSRVEDFFRKVMRAAKKETGFPKKRGDVSVYATFVSEGLLEIIFYAAGKGTLLQKEEDGQQPSGIRTAILKSKDLQYMMEFCRQVQITADAELYRYKGNYFLLADMHAAGMKQTAVFFHMADDYMDAVSYAPGIAAFLQEHGECMLPEDAIGILGRL